MPQNNTITIGSKKIGSGQPPYIIAEIGSNHNGDMELCKAIIDASVRAGADAVKFQSWSDTSLISDAEYENNPSYTDKHKHFGSLKEMVQKYQFTPTQHQEINAYCSKKEITFLSTAFSKEEVDLLQGLNVPCFKIASMDINHLPLLEYVGSQKKPVILSTGMATLEEIKTAVDTLQKAGSTQVMVLHCVSLYPPDDALVHLNNITMLQSTFDLPVGFSDHTLGPSISLAAIALGACIIEKHFTIDKTLEGWDHAISADEVELKTIVNEGCKIHHALGSHQRVVSSEELKKQESFRRSIVLNKDVPEGRILFLEDFDYKRPGTHIPPTDVHLVEGKKAIRSLKKGALLTWEDIA